MKKQEVLGRTAVDCTDIAAQEEGYQEEDR